jgi:hypothetical protein
MNWRNVFAGLGLIFAVVLIGTGLFVRLNPPPRIARGAAALRATAVRPANPASGGESAAAGGLGAVYPSDWPAELRYPADLGLVNASARPVEWGTEWSAVLAFHGSAPEAAEVLDRYFAARGWRVVREGVLPDPAILEIAKEGNRSGFIRIEADDNPEATRIVAAIVLPPR